jgi:hypothetical protein
VSAQRDHHERVPEPFKPLSRSVGRVFRDLEHRARCALARANPHPVFVLGNQKSGTTAIAELLARMCELSIAVDLRREILRPTYPRVVTGEMSFSRYLRLNRWEFSHDIVKEPNLTLLYPQLAAHFPEMRCALVLRDPRDNLRSLLNRVGIPGDLPELAASRIAAVDPGWDLVLDGRWLGLAGDHYIEQLAARWNLCADVHLANAERVVALRYEDFVTDKVGAIRGLARSLALTPRRDIADQVDIQFQSRGDRGVAWPAFFGEENLARIERVCGERMRALGYPRSSGV